MRGLTLAQWENHRALLGHVCRERLGEKMVKDGECSMCDKLCAMKVFS